MDMWRVVRRMITKASISKTRSTRVRQGMKAMLRYGSAWHDVASQVGAITQLGLDPRRFILVTDDSHAQTLSHEGHMDRVLRHAIAQGLPPMTAIQMMTINTAEHFGLAREMGMIAPGRWADVVLVKDLNNFKADIVIAKGRVIAQNGKWTVDLPKSHASRLGHEFGQVEETPQGGRFQDQVKSQKTNAKANIIGVIENQAPTKHLICDVQIEDGEIQADLRAGYRQDRLRQAPQRNERHLAGPGERVWFYIQVRGRLDGGARQPPHDRRRHG